MSWVQIIAGTSLCAASHWPHSQPRLSTVNMTLPAFAAERRCLLSIDISCSQQTLRMPLLLSIELTNGRTLDRFIHLSLRTIGPTTKSVVALHAELRTVYIWHGSARHVHSVNSPLAPIWRSRRCGII